jgi:hypothetical protein
MTHAYNAKRISPKRFLLEVMWDETVEMSLRLDAADKLTHWIQHGDFHEPDLTYRIPEMELQ